MESQEDTCVAHAAGSMFLALEYPQEAVDQLNLLKPLLNMKASIVDHGDPDTDDVVALQHATPAAADNHMMMSSLMQGGNIMNDGWIHAALDHSYHGMSLNMQKLGAAATTLSIMQGQYYDLEEYDQNQNAEAIINKEQLDQTSGFDPICFLKLPVLAGATDKGSSPPIDPKFLSYYGNQQDYGLSLSSTWSMQADHQHAEDYSSYLGLSSATSNVDMDGERALLQGFIGGNMQDMIASNGLYGADDHRKEIRESNDMNGDGQNHHLMHDINVNGQPFHHQQNPMTVQLGNKGSTGKRKRSRACKNIEEIESQRMTHIAVERNRRRQMNEHLRVLRALMPPSYVQRGDQASIIGGAIEFVKELEQLLQCLESQKRRRIYAGTGAMNDPLQLINASSSSNNSKHIMMPPPNNSVDLQMQLLPNYDPSNEGNNGIGENEGMAGMSMSGEDCMNGMQLAAAGMMGQNQQYEQVQAGSVQGEGLFLQQHELQGHHELMRAGPLVQLHEEVAEARCAVADIEVKVVGCDAIIKILSQRRPRQLLHTIAALQHDLRLTIFHTNVTTIDHTVLYSFTVKVEHDHASTAKEIATSVQQIFINLIQMPMIVPLLDH